MYGYKDCGGNTMPNTNVEPVEDLPYDEYVIEREFHVPNKHPSLRDTIGKHGRRIQAVETSQSE
jgi:hypothetical protein